MGFDRLKVVPEDEELLELVEGQRFEELHELVSVDEVADAWLAHDASSVDETRWWSVQLWFDEPDEAGRRAMLSALVERATDDQVGAVAAGPLETFVADDESRLTWIDRQAARSARFRRALAMICAEDLLDGTFARLERAARAPLPRSDRERYERRSR